MYGFDKTLPAKVGDTVYRVDRKHIRVVPMKVHSYHLFGSRRDVVELVKNCFCFIRDFRGEVPGASAKDCGNYLDMNLPMANYWGAKYAALLENIDETRLIYPE